ncbi:MAG TPA: TonB-dependent receptor, partial [Caulobacteraceae bacterium]
MKTIRQPRRRALLAGAAVLALWTGTAHAQDARHSVNIAPQPLVDALLQLSRQADIDIVAAADLTRGRTAPQVTGELTPAEAMNQLLAGSGLAAQPAGAGYIIARADQAPQSGSAAGGGAEVEALIVTAQKREEDIQDVPIAISAFSAKALEAQKIEGGFDLLKAIPNVTFTKTNFTSYNFQIRGIGTQAISATTDPGVAVAFNNTGLIQNRLFEQEYLDIERVEVLRGPQGTLYGRNATAGVINVISAKPNLHEFDGWLKGEVGNYHAKRVSAMVNVPLVEDKLAIRIAGALTDRQGYDYNLTTKHAVNGRDLWSGRITLAFNPTDHIRSNLIWERFKEDDNRSRTGKQLCHRDDGPTEVGGQSLDFDNDANFTQSEQFLLRRAFFGQGCKAGNLYEDAAFGTPNGLSYAFVLGPIITSQALFPFTSADVGYDPQTGRKQALIKFADPYGGKMQSRNLREISSILDPRYRAKADVVELNFDVDLTDNLTFYSQTAYDKDETYSFQDFNRFSTGPVFTDTSVLRDFSDPSLPTVYEEAAPGGIFCDPQLGCSNTLAGFDIAQASATQFSQEFRLQSNFDGPLNFSVGANYTKFDTLIDYYVMFNLITAIASVGPFNAPVGSIYSNPNFIHDPNAPYDPTTCAWSNIFRGVAQLPDEGPVPTDNPRSACPYIDPNPIDFSKNFEGEGHNYFRSKNPYKLKSWAVFGEAYWNIRDNLKLTTGLRYTDDRKKFTVVPSQVLLAPSYLAGGT